MSPDHIEASDGGVVPPYDQLDRVFRGTFNAWAQFAQRSELPGFPQESIQPSALLIAIPPFPLLEELKLQNVQGKLGLTGQSSWQTHTDRCATADRVIPAKLMFLGKPQPVTCDFTTEESSTLRCWPGIRNSTTDRAVAGNYLAVLTLAWEYILSAKWVQLAGNCANITVHPQVQHNDIAADDIIIDIGELPNDAMRWWTAILSQDQGWSATLDYNGTQFHSPWSYTLRPGSPRLRVKNQCSETSYATSAPTPESAMMFLAKFCRLHQIQGQCSAALSAALMMPAHHQATLPLPKPYLTTSQQCEIRYEDVVLREEDRIQQYMTLSCYGLHSKLWSFLYCPDLSCNEVSPYIEAISQVVNPILYSTDQVRLACLFAQRQPRLAAFWLGAIITGFHTTLIPRFLKDGVRLMDIHDLAWTSTLNSFIFDVPTVASKLQDISREDECRLRFTLDQDATVPISPWKPFGYTKLEDADIVVQIHAGCGHSLRYAGWRWDGQTNEKNSNTSSTPLMCCAPCTGDDYVGLRHYVVPDDMIFSRHCTHGVMSWLRPDGCARSEQISFQHEWIKDDDTEEDTDEGDEDTDEGDELREGGSPNSTLLTESVISRWLQIPD